MRRLGWRIGLPRVAMALGLAALAAIARQAAADVPSALYRLDPNAGFEYGCFGPCECPVFGSDPVSGTFLLAPTGCDPLFCHYAVSEVTWSYTIWDYVQGAARTVRVTGSGTYLEGGEFARQQRLVLDLSSDGAPPQHFDSGLALASRPFPGLDVSVWLHGGFCFDTTFAVKATPDDPAAVFDPRSPAGLVALRPNPFRRGLEVEFALRATGWTSLRGCDVAGREVSVLEEGVLAAGPHRTRWDGRDASGRDARPGVFFVILRNAGHVDRRAIVRLE